MFDSITLASVVADAGTVIAPVVGLIVIGLAFAYGNRFLKMGKRAAR